MKVMEGQEQLEAFGRLLGRAMPAFALRFAFITSITCITFITYSSSNLHMPNQVLINPMVRVVDETFLGLLQLV